MFAAVRAWTKYVPKLSPLKVVEACQPLVGVVVADVLMAYSMLCPFDPPKIGAFTVMLFSVVLRTVGKLLRISPSPLATALAVMVPVGAIAAVAPLTLEAGMLVARVSVIVFVLYVVGVPVIGMVTTVLLVL